MLAIRSHGNVEKDILLVLIAKKEEKKRKRILLVVDIADSQKTPPTKPSHVI
jgi:hypothetical protein